MVIDMNNNFSLGCRIRELRMTSGLTQEQAAFRANITPAYWGQIERNIKNPTVMILQKICDALDFPISEFFTDLPPAPRELDEPSMQILHLLEQRSVEEKEVLLQMMKLLNKLRDAPSLEGPSGDSSPAEEKQAAGEASVSPHPTCHPDIPYEGA